MECGSASSSCVTVVFLNAGSAALSESGCYDDDGVIMSYVILQWLIV